MEQDDYLPLSGIQHFSFCRRQWALIHVEEVWRENYWTVAGKHFHERVDDPYGDECRGDIIVQRSIPIISHRLRLQGVADVVEYHRCSDGMVKLNHKSGLWKPYPIEYKRGKPKEENWDRLQLCAQAICLEEMLGANILEGFLFYGTTKRRVHVNIDNDLRDEVFKCSSEMNTLFQASFTPPAEIGARCSRCSLANECLPKLTQKKQSVERYVMSFIEENL